MVLTFQHPTPLSGARDRQPPTRPPSGVRHISTSRWIGVGFGNVPHLLCRVPRRGCKRRRPSRGRPEESPANLTQLTVRNNVKYPEDRVAHAISGDTQIGAHGSRGIPVWSDIFKSLNAGTADLVRPRIVNLTDYEYRPPTTKPTGRWHSRNWRRSSRRATSSPVSEARSPSAFEIHTDGMSTHRSDHSGLFLRSIRASQAGLLPARSRRQHPLNFRITRDPLGIGKRQPTDRGNPSYSRVSRLRQALKVLHGTANTLNLHSKAPQHIDGNHPPVGIEGNHVREHAAKGEGFRGFA